jgi:hypothetical protein
MDSEKPRKPQDNVFLGRDLNTGPPEYEGVVAESERKRVLGISKHGWEDNIKMELTWCENVGWIRIPPDAAI